ncbi:MAG: translocation/assembly module TamB domain-containing protein [Bacteroidota bacterium]
MIQGVYIEDHGHDTLLYAGEAQIKITDLFILKKGRNVISYIGLHDTYVHLYRKQSSSEWNYQFIIDAFDNGKKDTSTQQWNIDIDLEKVVLQKVRFHMDDAWGGGDVDVDVGSLVLKAKQLDLKRKSIDIHDIDIGSTSVVVKNYKGGKPKTPHTLPYSEMFDNTPFNDGKFIILCDKLSLDKCAFRLESDTNIPVAGEFDPSHIYINNINVKINDAGIIGDTIQGHLSHLTAYERSGVIIKEMHSDISVSPVASICKNLYLETNNSKIYDYYAMLYRHFPDFLDYIDKVVMVGHLKNASIDSKDIAFFAPQLHNIPTAILKVSGTGSGTVADLEGKDISVTDGISTIKGDIKMKGLPDMYTTFIDYQKGEILTNGPAVFKYAPILKDNPNIALDHIIFAYFNGNYTGYLENFNAKGILKTNLGTLVTDVKLKIPIQTTGDATYSGTVSTTGFNAGDLFRLSYLGNISFSADIDGKGFDLKNGAQIQINTEIDSIWLKGYNYQNITANGELEKRKFDGELQIDDPNLALSFNGDLDFSHELAVINARAYLLKSDFKKLNLLKDSIQAVADFDLNCTGKSIDDFTGYAKFFNVDIKRNNHRLDLDSIFIRSSLVNGQKLLTVESNEISAHIKGNYELSKLGYSTQYYLSGYLPNYIAAPSQIAPDQNLTFDVSTRNIDSLLGIIIPKFRGFDNSSVRGSLNTSEQNLTLNAKIPIGIIGNVHMTNVSIKGDGNYKKLTLIGNADNLTIGDSILNISVATIATIGNDSFKFNVTTATPYSYGTAAINGEAYTHGDSLYLTLLPSDFYLGQTKWQIPAGDHIVYTDKFLQIKDLYLQSGQQQVAINTQNESTKQSLIATVKNINIAQLGDLFSLSSYQPTGSINGKIQLDNLFGAIYINSDIKAQNVQIGSDTLDNIILVGSYNSTKKEIRLDSRSGIFHDGASITADGNMSLDSTSEQKIDGAIHFENAPISWITPLVAGYVSHLSGVLNGTINLSGPASLPIFNGNVSLRYAGVHVDYMGTNYTIPSASINFNRQNIEIGNMAIYDVKKNRGMLTGNITHNGFRDFALNLELISPKLEVINLKDYENKNFYGNLIADVQRFTVTGPIENIVMSINGSAADKSHIYIPINQTGGGISTYNYVTFKTYNSDIQKENKHKKSTKYKFTLNINANVTPDAELTLIIDPASGDAINAKGNCSNLQMNMVLGGDFRLYGTYTIDEGDYTFSLKQILGFSRKFKLNSGSQITFNGAIAQTNLAVNATYALRTRLYDLLSELDIKQGGLSSTDISEAKVLQNVNVLLHMNGPLQKPELTFNIDLPEKRSIGTYANSKLDRVNQSDRDLLDEVGSLLLVGTFIPPEGLGGAAATAQSGAINNFSEIISSTASSQLTNIMNKLLGDRKLSVELKYKNYNTTDINNITAINRNSVSVGLSKRYLNERLVVDFGSIYDWGKPSSSSSNSASNFNLAGDFRVQYLLTEDGRLRLNGFHTSDYDAVYDQNITRNGVGLSWRKSFNSLPDFFHGKKYEKKQQAKDTSGVRGNQ